MEGVCDRYATTSREERDRLAGTPSLVVNMRLVDLEWLCELYAKARAAFVQQRDIHRDFCGAPTEHAGRGNTLIERRDPMATKGVYSSK